MTYLDYGDESLNGLIASLKQKLPAYLVEKGVTRSVGDTGLPDFEAKFLCINPEHKDTNPSMGFIPKEKTKDGHYSVIRCWSCGFKADIFNAASILDGLPKTGSEWIQGNVYALANRYGEKFKPIVPTEAQLAKAKILQLYSDAADVFSGLIQTVKDPSPFRHTRERNLSDATCVEWNVGTVEWPEFIRMLCAYGPWDQEFVKAHGIDERTFGNDFITFTLRDHKGNVVAFDRRFVHYDSTEEQKARAANRPYPSKFLRTNESVGITPKAIFYGLDKVEETWKRTDIVEGYIDTLSTWQAGHRRVIGALGTSTIDTAQVDLLVKQGISSCGILMDGDGPGEKATEKIIEAHGDRADIRFWILQLDYDENIPPKDRDPNTYFRTHTYEDFCKKTPISSFSFRLLLQEKKGAKGLELIKTIIPQLASEPDPLIRGEQIRELAARTQVREDDIRDAVKVLLSGSARKIADKVRMSLEKVRSPDDLLSIAESLKEKANKLPGKKLMVGRLTALSNMDMAMTKFDSEGGAMMGFKTGIELYDKMIMGFPKDKFVIVGGTPNSGKTAWTDYTVYGLLSHIDANSNLAVAIHSLDDPVVSVFAKLIAIRMRIPISHALSPHLFRPRSDPNNAEFWSGYEEARAWIRNLVVNGHLYAYGAESGVSVDILRKSVNDVKEKTGRHVVLVVDSFHNLNGAPGEEERSRYEHNSKSLKRMGTDGVTVLVTAECNKVAQGTKPRMKDISETRGLSYDGDLILVPYNELNELRDKAEKWWVMENRSNPNGFVKKPIIEMEIEKNKINDDKGTWYYKFVDYQCRFEGVQNIEAEMRIQEGRYDQMRRARFAPPVPQSSPGSINPLHLPRPNERIEAPRGAPIHLSGPVG